MPETVPFIIANAHVDVTFSTGTIKDLQDLYAYLLEGRSEVDAEGIRTKLEQKQPLEPWEHAIVVMTTLINKIHTNASTQGQVEFKPLEDGLKGLTPQ